MTDVKFCGITRADDARYAASLGARYVGVILTQSPRQLDAGAARAVFAAVPTHVRRVGVFGTEPSHDIIATTRQVGLDVVQLHGDQSASEVARVRAVFDGELWWVARVQGARLPPAAHALGDIADAIVLDARVEGARGGTGVVLDWERLRDEVERLRGRSAVVLAGGLTPENVGRAVDTLRPDVVDVSSGVETAPGIKDHDRMRRFRDAALSPSAR